jgi:hypothetical protein
MQAFSFLEYGNRTETILIKKSAGFRNPSVWKGVRHEAEKKPW